jgi:hypothetical protein
MSRSGAITCERSQYQLHGKAAGAPFQRSWSQSQLCGRRLTASSILAVKAATSSSALPVTGRSAEKTAWCLPVPSRQYSRKWTGTEVFAAATATAGPSGRGGRRRAKIELPWAVYQISGGMPGPTFMLLLPMKSLSKIDAAIARAGTIREAEGPENEKALAKLASDGFATVESNVFAFSPAMSYPSKEFVARDPEFWTPKPEAKPAAPAKKAGAGPKGEAKPADKK